jgi:hypothetical protein
MIVSAWKVTTLKTATSLSSSCTQSEGPSMTVESQCKSHTPSAAHRLSINPQHTDGVDRVGRVMFLVTVSYQPSYTPPLLSLMPCPADDPVVHRLCLSPISSAQLTLISVRDNEPMHQTADAINQTDTPMRFSLSWIKGISSIQPPPRLHVATCTVGGTHSSYLLCMPHNP